MTLEQLKTMSNEIVQAIHAYKLEKDYDEIELERTIDELLCRLPRDIVYVEWYDRSDIENMANGVYDEPVGEHTVDTCMDALDRFDGSIMENYVVENIVIDTVKQQREQQNRTCDFCGRIIGDMPCKDDGETIMCQVCEQSGRFGHYDTNKE